VKSQNCSKIEKGGGYLEEERMGHLKEGWDVFVFSTKEAVSLSLLILLSSFVASSALFLVPIRLDLSHL
jgi:hypothetical protein